MDKIKCSPPEYLFFTEEVLAESIAESELISRVIDNAISTLPERLQKILRMRFWDEMTLRECGKVLGVSVERARQLELAALRKFRRFPRSAMLDDCRGYFGVDWGRRE